MGGNRSWRKLLVLVSHLPPESALNTAIRNNTPETQLAGRVSDPAAAPWSRSDTLTAILIDEIRNLGWMYAQSHSESRIPRPEPLPRPGVKVRKRRLMSLAAIRQLDPRMRNLTDEEVRERMEALGRG